MKRIGLLSLATTTALMAGGYIIPEQSLNAVALSGAYIANAKGADAGYYNPANMAFMDQGQYVEADLTYVHLTSVDFEGTVNSPVLGAVPSNASSKKENAVIPTIHYVSEAYGDYRFGVSLTVPAALAKRWEEGGASTLVSKKFSLQVIELNPVVSYKVSDNFAIAGGLRVIHSKGMVKSEGTTAVGLAPNAPFTNPPFPNGPVLQTIERNMEGDDIGFGYNLAISYKPVDALTLAATYRSNIDMKLEGDAELSASNYLDATFTDLSLGGAATYNGPVNVTVPLPAVLSLATAYTFNEKTTLELEYSRVYWSKYNSLDFEGYNPSLNGVLKAAYDDPKARNWKDSNTYRLGLTHEFSKQWTGMAAYAYDETPIPTDTVSFDLPDADQNIYSMGARYQYDEQVSVGLAGLFADKKDVTTGGSNDVKGTFSNISAYLISLGVSYKF